MRKRWAQQSAARSATAPESRTASPPPSRSPSPASCTEVVDLVEDTTLHRFFRAVKPKHDSTAQPGASSSGLGASAKPSRFNVKLNSHGPLPTVHDLAKPPLWTHASPAKHIAYPKPDWGTPLSPPPTPRHSSSGSEALASRGLKIPPPPAPPRSLQQQAPQKSQHQETQHFFPPAPTLGPSAKCHPPRPLRVQPNSTRKASQLRMQACCTAWCQIIHHIADASDLFTSLQACKDTDKHISAVLREYRPSTLERYLRIAWLLVMFLSSSETGFSDLALHQLLDFLAAARASHSQDREVHQISAQSAIKALRWLSRQAQWNALATALDSPVIKAYAVRGTAKDRREALPIPWCLVASWEHVICQPRTALCTKLALGAMLLATHASLRFGDVQRIDVSSLSLSCTALHGTCYATKTRQPFAVALGGISGRDTASCWTLHWLASLRNALEQVNTPKHQVDFLWFNAQPELAKLQELAPASYCTAMLTLRWAATLPWQQPGQGLHSAEAKQLTLHSMKSTALASAAQLRLDKELRLFQGHHRDSADLYSRNDVFASLDVQHRISKALASGWRAERSIARGGQAPIPEPPFNLPPGEPVFSLPATALMQGPWQSFVTRHEALLAQRGPDTSGPAPPKHASPAQETARASPSHGPPSDEEADMVERAALQRANSVSSASSTVSSTASQAHTPFVIRAEFSARFACMGPWGRWHALSPDSKADQTSRTACGMELGIAAQVSEFPQEPFCRRKACVNARRNAQI